jgi:hypothetical protein
MKTTNDTTTTTTVRKGMTVSDLKDLIHSWPEFDATGEPTTVCVAATGKVSNPCVSVTTVNKRLGCGGLGLVGDVCFEACVDSFRGPVEAVQIPTKELNKMWVSHPNRGVQQFIRLLNPLLDKLGVFLQHSNSLDHSVHTDTQGTTDGEDYVTLHQK